jgi:hypothetical protein
MFSIDWKLVVRLISDSDGENLQEEAGFSYIGKGKNRKPHKV